MRRTFTTLLVLSLLVFLVNGLVHAVIPHDHGVGQESKWSQMHGALRLEEKATFIISITIALTSVTFFLSHFVPNEMRALLPELLLLRRGVHKYRRFR